MNQIPAAITSDHDRSPFTSIHKVQFYEKDDDLTSGLGSTLGSALGAGGSAVVIATKHHRRAIRAVLEAKGLDVNYVIQEGRYIPLDASETLSKILVDGWPDDGRFQATVGTLVDQASAAATVAQGYVAAFGEMVSLLWKAGGVEQAIRLEQLWNELAQTRTFYLHCAYPIADFNHSSHEDPFSRICSEHTHVIPGESYSSVRSELERSRVVSRLQQKVQALQKMLQDRPTSGIRAEICRALELLAADHELRSIVGSWGGTISDEEIVEMLREWNASYDSPTMRNRRFNVPRRGNLTPVRAAKKCFRPNSQRASTLWRRVSNQDGTPALTGQMAVLAKQQSDDLQTEVYARMPAPIAAEYDKGAERIGEICTLLTKIRAAR